MSTSWESDNEFRVPTDAITWRYTHHIDEDHDLRRVDAARGRQLRERKKMLGGGVVGGRIDVPSENFGSSPSVESRHEQSSVEDLLRVMDAKRERLEPLSPSEIQAVKLREIAGWFLDCMTHERLGVSQFGRLKRDNVQEWLAWAFFHEKLAEVQKNDVKLALLDQLLKQVESWSSLSLAFGYDKTIKPMRISFDPIRFEPRPWIYYLVTQMIVPAFSDAKLRALGFVAEQSGSLRYWRRPGSSPAIDSDSRPFLQSNAVPLVFCHGVGIGLAVYLHFVEQLVHKFKERPIFLLTFPHISLRLQEDVLSASELVACIGDMLAAHHESFAEMEFLAGNRKNAGKTAGGERAGVVGSEEGISLLGHDVARREEPETQGLTSFVAFLLVMVCFCLHHNLLMS